MSLMVGIVEEGGSVMAQDGQMMGVIVGDFLIINLFIYS